MPHYTNNFAKESAAPNNIPMARDVRKKIEDEIYAAQLPILERYTGLSLGNSINTGDTIDDNSLSKDSPSAPNPVAIMEAILDYKFAFFEYKTQSHLLISGQDLSESQNRIKELLNEFTGKQAIRDIEHIVNAAIEKHTGKGI